jgi:hypothetical protein
MTTESFRLTRTGNRPLSFDGALISISSSREHESSRWHELALYRTSAGKWVLSVVFRTLWQGEHDHHSAEIFDGPELAAAWLSGFGPTSNLLGYPDSEAYRAKQERLEKLLSQRFAVAVSGLLDGITCFDERID